MTLVAWGLSALAHGVLLLGMEWLPLCLQFLLLGGVFIALAWLLVRYNRPLAQWRVVGLIWLTYSLLRLFTVGLYASGIPFLSDNGATFALLLALEALLAGWSAILVLAIRRDVSLAYLALFFALGAPVLRVLVIQAGGVLNFLTGQNSYSPFEYFSWIEPSLMALSCMATMGFLSFLPHLAWLLIRERQRR